MRHFTMRFWKAVYRTTRVVFTHLCRKSIENFLVISILYIALCMKTSSGHDVLPQKEKYLPDYKVYHNLTRIQSHLKELVERNPNYLKIDWQYTSRQNRPQFLLRMTNFTDGHRIRVTGETVEKRNKIRILLSFGEHAREFLPIESLFYLLKNITGGLSKPETDPGYQFSRYILSQADIFIVALMNPDGRKYVENTGNYCWRGTSTGVDLNRNFDWSYGNKGSSNDVKDEEYRGTEPFSEPECLVLVDITSRFQFDAFVSFHSGIRQIYVPFADTDSKKSERKPANVESMLELADVLAKSSVNRFTYGLAYQLNEYTADGTIFDYMAGKRKIPFSFAVELWGEGDSHGAKCFDLFNPMSQNLQTAVQELHPLYVALFQHLIAWKEQQVLEIMDPFNEAPSLTFGLVLLGAVIIFFAIVAVHNRLPACLRLYPRRRIVSIRALSSTFSLFRP